MLANAALATAFTLAGIFGGLDSYAQSRPRLTATLTVSAARVPSVATLSVTVVLRNNTTQTVVIPAQILTTAILLLEVRNDRGERVNTVPPPVPTAETVALVPGAERRVVLGLNVFSPTLPAGRYTVRPRGAVIEGAAVAFRVGR